MITLQYLRLDIGKVILRFYLVMAVVIIGGFSGQWWIATLAFPIFLSTMLAIKINIKTPIMNSKKPMESNSRMAKV